jgi:hypothetical protein
MKAIKKKSSKNLEFIEIIEARKDPIVAISLPDLSTLSPEGISEEKAVGFILEDLSTRLRLVATCGHAIRQLEDPNKKLLVAHRVPNGILGLEVKGVIHDPKEENDLSFLIVNDPSASKKIHFKMPIGEPQIPSNNTLYNSKNAGSLPFGRFDLQHFRQANVLETDYYQYSRRLESELICINRTDFGAQKEIEEAGYIKHRVFNMMSRPGFSGSPIFDDNGTLFGMNLRGTNPKQENYQGDLVACLPTSEIIKGRQRIEKQLRTLLREI